MTANTIIIHGGGYVGLTGAVHAALSGYNVIVYDPDSKVVKGINSGKPRAGEYLGYIDDNIKTLVDEGKLTATSNLEHVLLYKTHLVAVPTEKGDEPYLDIVKEVIYHLISYTPQDSIIIVESTLQPGTIDKLHQEYKLIPVMTGEKFLAVCPRLDWFADKEKNLTNLPRIVGGFNQESTDKAVEVLKPICKDIRKTNYRAAELAKAGQNALYFVQIMAAHELAERYQNFTDMNEALRLIGVHWRLPNLYLGPGTSGRCVAMGAKYIVEGSPSYNKFGGFASLIRDAIHADIRWREKIADRMTRDLSYADSLEAKLLVMGVAYSPNFSDFGYSAGLYIAKYLNEYSWNVSIHDPVLSLTTLKTFKLPIWSLLSSNRNGLYENDFTAVLLATGHDAYKDFPMKSSWKNGALVLDACGLWEKYRKFFKEIGVKYVRVGEQGWLHNPVRSYLEDHLRS